MAEGERQPLLFKGKPERIRPSNFSPTSSVHSSSNTNTSSFGQRSDRADAKTEILDVKNTSNWQVRGSLASILLAVVLERLTYYGITGNLVLFLNEAPYLWESYHAISASFLFFGISYIMSLVGGWISDSFLGRFKTIVLSYGIYLCGSVLLPFLASFEEDDDANLGNVSLPKVCAAAAVKAGNSSPVESLFDEQCAWLIFLTLIIIAIAAGILKANICPFGADQVFLELLTLFFSICECPFV